MFQKIKIQRLRERRGFSFLEVIFFVAISAIILVAVMGIKNNVGGLQNFINQKLMSRQDLDQTFQILVTEIRSAQPSGLGSYPIVAATSTSFTFFSDVDRDSLIDQVRYFWATSTVSSTVTNILKRGVIKPTGSPFVYATSSEKITTVVNNIILSTSTPIFSYFGSAATTTAVALTYPIDVASIRFVKINLWVDINPGVSPKASLFTDTVTIRNLRSN
jgi:Tfp pilus assembly protein PilW